MNQFSNTWQSVTTVDYGELLWTSVSNNLSPRLQKSAVHSEAKCCLSPVAAVCWYLFVIWRSCGEEGEEQNIISREQLRLSAPYRQNDTKNVIKFSKPCHLYSTLSVQLFSPYHLSPILLVILLTVTVTVQILPVTAHDAQTVAQR